jgi:hypothetical protein
VARSGAERERASKARRECGRRIAHVEVDDVALAETLIAFGLLSRDDADDTAKADAALSRAVDAWTSS